MRLQLEASEQKITIGEHMLLKARSVERLMFS